jgi:hypothetical protein
VVKKPKKEASNLVAISSSSRSSSSRLKQVQEAEAAAAEAEAANERTYAKFLGANTDNSLLSKAMYCTSLGEIDKYGNEALEAVGGKNGGLSSYEKYKYFNHYGLST